MKHSLVIIAVAFAALLCFADLQAQVTPRSGALCDCVPTGVRAIDGDTLVVDAAGISVRVRLYGIDAPEIDQPYGQRAALALTSLTVGRPLRIETKGTDRYGHILALVGTDQVADVGLRLVQLGAAWHVVKYAPERRDLAAAQDAAKRAHIGLWAEKTP